MTIFMEFMYRWCSGVYGLNSLRLLYNASRRSLRSNNTITLYISNVKTLKNYGDRAFDPVLGTNFLHNYERK